MFWTIFRKDALARQRMPTTPRGRTRRAQCRRTRWPPRCRRRVGRSSVALSAHAEMGQLVGGDIIAHAGAPGGRCEQVTEQRGKPPLWSGDPVTRLARPAFATTLLGGTVRGRAPSPSR
jgi:hypothetical protein